MTGYGEAHRQADGLAVAVEVRSINSRYFKLTVRSGDGQGGLEPQIEELVRLYIKRGTVQVGLRMDRALSPDDYRINDVVFTGYRRQLEAIYDRLHVSESIRLDALLGLPGVVDERPVRQIADDSEWPVIEQTLREAMEHLTRMRQAEGSAMAEDLRSTSRSIDQHVEQIRQRSPVVVQAYRDRLADRLNKLLADFEVTVEAADVVREVGMFAERSDISEEIVRLRSHLSQFESAMASGDRPGRKLEFLIQEMFREANTIGSKANDAEIATHVVEVKTAIERMREMVQNVE